MRGVGQWLDTGMAGRICRGAFSVVAAAQYYAPVITILEELMAALSFLNSVPPLLGPRPVPLQRRSVPPVIVWTDAADDLPRHISPSGARIGAFILIRKPIVGSTGFFVRRLGLVFDVPQSMIARLDYLSK